MTALEMQSPDGQTTKLIVRRPRRVALTQNPRAAQDEFQLLQVTHSLGLATPLPVHLDLSGQIFAAPYLVIAFVEGSPEFAPSDLSSYVLQLATHLARIHSVDCSNLDLSFLPSQANVCAETMGRQPPKADGSLDEGRVRETLHSIGSLSQHNAPVLLHGDFWPGNILWHDGKLVAVIDWEDARLGDPLTDLAISRLDMATILGIDAMAAFTRHYRSLMPIDYTNLPYWDLCAALRLLRLSASDFAAWAAYFPSFGRHDITERTIRDSYRLFVTQALEELAVV
jgi:aminoglycoside phosphotransferase (APT) family kinase protein